MVALRASLPPTSWLESRLYHGSLMGIVVLVWLSATGGPLIARSDKPQEVVLISDRVNGVHRDLAVEIAPIQQGAFTVRLTSPSHRLEILEHELRLRPMAGGAHAALLWARFQGEADVEADLDIAGLPGQIADFVELPLQEMRLEGQVELSRVGDSYRLVTVSLPPYAKMKIRSRLGGQLVSICRTLTLFSPGGGAECDLLQHSLSELRLPLPEPGSDFSITAAQLTENERHQLDAYLARSSHQ